MKTIDRNTQFGKDIAFGIEQTTTCQITDLLLDPYVGEKIQSYFEDNKHKGSLKHTWLGEWIGDGAALAFFIALQRFFPQPVEWLTRTAKKMFGPVYEWTGKKELRARHIDPHSPEYKKKMEEWKEFQAENFAKSSVISGMSVVTNVLAQRQVGNTHKYWVIGLSKLAGTAITMATMLGLRFIIPKTMQQMDDELNEHYFSPLICKTQNLMGAPVELEAIAQKAEQPPKEYAEKIQMKRRQSMESEHYALAP